MLAQLSKSCLNKNLLRYIFKNTNYFKLSISTLITLFFVLIVISNVNYFFIVIYRA